jgi:lysozyme
VPVPVPPPPVDEVRLPDLLAHPSALFTIGATGLALIKHFESLRLNAYPDPVGIWTIGYGAIRGLDGRPVTASHPPLTENQAAALLRRDCEICVQGVRRLVPVDLTQYEFDALCSFAFNLGSGALQSSSLRQCILRGDLDDAAQQFNRWVFAKGRRLEGLVRRRKAESQLFDGYWSMTLGKPPVATLREDGGVAEISGVE